MTSKNKLNPTVSADIYTEDYFQSRCGGLEFFHRYGDQILKPLMQLAVQAAELKPGMVCWDIGCGRGELTSHLQKKGYVITGVDYAKDAIDLAKRTFPEASFQIGRVEELNISDHSVDRIFFLGTIEHLYDSEIRDTLRTFERMLKPDGMVIITTCTNRLYFKVWTYHFRASLVRYFRKLNISIKEPEPPRSEEDESMHVNEQSYFSLKKIFKEMGWKSKIDPRPNHKYCVTNIYGENIPNDFPLKKRGVWKSSLYRVLMKIFPFYLLLARNHVVTLSR